MARGVILYFIIFHFPLILAKSWLCRGGGAGGATKNPFCEGRRNGIHQTLHCVMLLTFNAAFASNGEHCRLDVKLKRWISFTVHHNKIANSMQCSLQTMIKARLWSQNTLFHLGNEYILSFSLIHLLCDIVENTFTVHTTAASPQSASALTVILRCHCDCDGSAKSWQSHTLRPCRLTAISLFSSSWGQSSWGGSEQHPGHTASHTSLPARCELHSFTRCHTSSCGLVYWLLERRQTWSLNLNGVKYFIDSRYFMVLQKTAYVIIYSCLEQLIIVHGCPIWLHVDLVGTKWAWAWSGLLCL